MEEIESDAMKWFDEMSEEQWSDIEREHGYYGHDMGTTKDDIIDMYKSEFSKPLYREERLKKLLDNK